MTETPVPRAAGGGSVVDEAARHGGPPLRRDECGSFGMRIGRDGTWYYLDSPIGRKPLVKLFASVLSRDEDGVYWLTTPVEHGTIEVEDAPFIAVEMEVVAAERPHDQVIRMRTNLDDWVEVDEEHPLRVVHDEATGEPSPYVYVKKGLEAKIARPVYYDLVAMAVEGKGEEAAPPTTGADGRDIKSEGAVVGVWSKGRFFPLGTI
jgi:hypothetical protein